MVKPPCYDKNKMQVKDGCWPEEEDAKRFAYAAKPGTSNWTALPKKAGKIVLICSFMYGNRMA